VARVGPETGDDGNTLMRSHLLLCTMARVDSMLWFMLGFAQLILGRDIGGGDPTLELLGIILQGTGGSSVILGIYFLMFLARHEKEFADGYSKMEKTAFLRDAEGRIIDLEDTTPRVIKAVWYVVPVGLTLIGALAWLTG
tara:strand:- start:809 stop:1228 length:420 start_codon:yes stop_codon:yes gene_type:complete